MSWIIDLIKELRLLGVHRERIALLEFKLSETDKQVAILENKNAILRAENSSLQTRLQEAQAEIQQLKEHIDVVEREKQQLQDETYKTKELVHDDHLDEIKTMLLIVIAAYGTCDVFQITGSLNTKLRQAGEAPLVTTRVESHLNGLCKDEFISMVRYAANLRPVQCSLKPRGEKYLEDKDLWPPEDAK